MVCSFFLVRSSKADFIVLFDLNIIKVKQTGICFTWMGASLSKLIGLERPIVY